MWRFENKDNKLMTLPSPPCLVYVWPQMNQQFSEVCELATWSNSSVQATEFNLGNLFFHTFFFFFLVSFFIRIQCLEPLRRVPNLSPPEIDKRTWRTLNFVSVLIMFNCFSCFFFFFFCVFCTKKFVVLWTLDRSIFFFFFDYY